MKTLLIIASVTLTIGSLVSIQAGSPYSSGSRYYDYTYRPSVAEHYVAPHYRSNGAVVPGHYQTNADQSFWNNWSSKGNTNPHTGRIGTTQPKLMDSYGRYRR